jgi:hypothetical protein
MMQPTTPTGTTWHQVIIIFLAFPQAPHNLLTKSVSRETKPILSLIKEVRKPPLFVLLVETLDLFHCAKARTNLLDDLSRGFIG